MKALEVENLTFSYPGKTILTSATMSAHPFKITGLLGGKMVQENRPSSICYVVYKKEDLPE